MKEVTTNSGKTYSVHTANGCTVSDDSGWSKELAAPEDYFTAHGGMVYLSDDSASVKELFKLAPYQKLRLLGVVGGDKLPVGYTRLAYLGAKAHCAFDTGLTVSSATGARVVALNEDVSNPNYCAVAGIYTQFMVAGINPSTKLISWCWSTLTNGSSYTTLLNGQVMTTSEANSHTSQWLKYSGGVFTARLNFMQSGAWDYEEGERFVSGALPSPVALSTSKILLFDRGSDVRYSWRGRIYEAQFTEGVRMTRNFVPVVNASGVPCMFDTVSRTEFFNKSANTPICGVETKGQLNTLLRGLPNLTGQDGKELYLRIYTPIYESAVASGIIEATATAKNWQIAYDPTTKIAA